MSSVYFCRNHGQLFSTCPWALGEHIGAHGLRDWMVPWQTTGPEADSFQKQKCFVQQVRIKSHFPLLFKSKVGPKYINELRIRLFQSHVMFLRQHTHLPTVLIHHYACQFKHKMSTISYFCDDSDSKHYKNLPDIKVIHFQSRSGCQLMQLSNFCSL